MANIIYDVVILGTNKAFDNAITEFKRVKAEVKVAVVDPYINEIIGIDTYNAGSKLVNYTKGLFYVYLDDNTVLLSKYVILATDLAFAKPDYCRTNSFLAHEALEDMLPSLADNVRLVIIGRNKDRAIQYAKDLNTANSELNITVLCKEFVQVSDNPKITLLGNIKEVKAKQGIIKTVNGPKQGLITDLGTEIAYDFCTEDLDLKTIDTAGIPISYFAYNEEGFIKTDISGLTTIIPNLYVIGDNSVDTKASGMHAAKAIIEKMRGEK